MESVDSEVDLDVSDDVSVDFEVESEVESLDSVAELDDEDLVVSADVESVVPVD